MFVIPSGKLMAVKLAQSVNADSPIVVTLLGIVTEVMDALRCPLTETRTLHRMNAIANRNDYIEVVICGII